jgi:hypothetical protein
MFLKLDYLNHNQMSNKIDWLNNIITAVISILVTVIAGALLFSWQTDKLELSYSFERIEPFVNQTEKLTIYHIQFKNSGSTTLEDIKGEISIDNVDTAEYKTSSLTPIDIIDSYKNKKIHISIKSLNKGESCKISILAKSTVDLPVEPQVQLRAKGVVGVKANSETQNEEKESKWLIMMIALSAMLASSVSIISKRIIGNITGRHTDGDQNHIFAYLCGVHKLKEEAERFMSIHGTTFWAEADRIGFLALNSQNNEYQNKLKSVLIDVISYAGSMAKNSEAICYFNIAKIEKSQGNKDKANEYLKKAKNISSALIEKRLKLDNFIN